MDLNFFSCVLSAMHLLYGLHGTFAVDVCLSDAEKCCNQKESYTPIYDRQQKLTLVLHCCVLSTA
jgi:hypothetical protein